MYNRLPDCLIELHLHLDGSLDPSTVRQLAMLQNIDIPLDDEHLLPMLSVDDSCEDLNEYLEKFKFPLNLLQSTEAIKLALYQLLDKLKHQGLIYAEIRFAPLLHRRNGLSMRQVVQSACEVLKYSPLKAQLILCCYRGESREDNLETVAVAKEFLGKGVCAIDLAGAEALFPNEMYDYVFEEAKRLGVPFTIHSGEAAGPQSVRKALAYGTKRLGHGVRSVEDPQLMKILRDENITLECCLTSNIQTAIYKDFWDFPLKTLVENGIRVTVNTDNMTVSATDLREEYGKFIEYFHIDGKQIEQFLHNSADAAFLSAEEKDILHRTISWEMRDYKTEEK